MSNAEVILQARGLSKRFGASNALDEVDMDLRAGEVHALVGSNGAGKSTLVKIISGVFTPDAGELTLNGAPLFTGGDPRVSLDAGIACIYQETNLVPALSALDNIVLGRHPTNRLGVLDRKAQRAFVERILEKHNLQIDPNVPVMVLSPVHQKEVEIAKALSLNARVILMDEPTAWLSHSEVEKLFTSIRGLCSQGVAVLYISHVLDEIFAIADRVTILRDGKVRLAMPAAEVSKATLVQAMLGRDLSVESSTLQDDMTHVQEVGEVVLECHGLSKFGVFQDVDLQVHKGEVVCITGLVGAKRSELVRALFGAEPADQGEILVHGERVDIRNPPQAVRLGMGFVPEDRRHEGLFMDLAVGYNMVIGCLPTVSRNSLLSERRVRALGQRQVEDLDVIPPRLDVTPRALSGGNQQKVLVGRWLAADAEILILDEPTAGIDVGAKAHIYRLLRDLSSKGAGILIVSSDIEEVLTVADRIVVMAQGRIVASFDKGAATQDHILHAASG